VSGQGRPGSAQSAQVRFVYRAWRFCLALS